jgi:hypothetical protein
MSLSVHDISKSSAQGHEPGRGFSFESHDQVPETNAVSFKIESLSVQDECESPKSKEVQGACCELQGSDAVFGLSSSRAQGVLQSAADDSMKSSNKVSRVTGRSLNESSESHDHMQAQRSQGVSEVTKFSMHDMSNQSLLRDQTQGSDALFGVASFSAQDMLNKSAIPGTLQGSSSVFCGMENNLSMQDISTSQECYPLQYAAAHGDTSTLETIIKETGADPNIEDSEGRTPLHHVALSHSPNAARAALLLINANADTALRDSHWYVF